jgi:hypothetical protein
MFNVPDRATELYLAALQASNGERHILAYFKQHPALIYRHPKKAFFDQTWKLNDIEKVK